MTRHSNSRYGFTYNALTDSRGVITAEVIVDDDLQVRHDAMIKIHHSHDGVMTFRPCMAGEAPTIVNLQAFHDLMDEASAQQRKTGFFGIYRDHPELKALAQAKAETLTRNVKGAAYRNAEKIIAEISAKIDSQPRPLTGLDPFTGEAI